MELSLRTVKHSALCAILSIMPLRSTALSQAARPTNPATLVENPRVQKAFEWFQKNLTWIDEQQIQLTEIPAPSFEEGKRAEAVKALLAAEGFTTHTDKLGNVSW